MALIDCMECGKKISDSAVSCPQCGAPVAPKPAGEPARKAGGVLGLGIFFIPMVFAWFLLRRGHSTFGRVVGFGWMALWIYMGVLHSHEAAAPEATAYYQAPQTDTAQDPENPTVDTVEDSDQTSSHRYTSDLDALPVFSAEEITTAYARNTVAADKRFKGKEFRVAGVVKEINTNFEGQPYAVLSGGVNEFTEPQFVFAPNQEDKIAQLERGDKVVLACVGDGDITKIPESKDCILRRSASLQESR